MAEKTDTKKIEASKESYKAPVAGVAEEVREEKDKVDKKALREKISEKLEEGEEKSGKSEKKKEFETVKKTVEAHGTLSEEEAEEKAKEIEKVAEKMIEKEGEEKAETKKTGESEEEKEDKKKRRGKDRDIKSDLTGWEPKTKLGEQVKNSEIKNIDEILDNNKVILEEQIVDSLLDLKSDLVSIGQAKGKFGGGKRRAWRQTQRKTQEGNVPTFSTMAVVGDENGHVGIGEGRSSETLPARDKAIRQAKLNIIKVERSCSAFDCACKEPHTIPFEVQGKSGSVKVTLIPAPQGTGLVVGNELKKILNLAGIKDVYSRTEGRKRTTFNLVKACFEALDKTKLRSKNNG